MLYCRPLTCTGADPEFQVRGGALKQNCAERREARHILGYFVWKITIFTSTNHISSNFRGGGGAPAGCAPPPGSAPAVRYKILYRVISCDQIMFYSHFRCTLFLSRTVLIFNNIRFCRLVDVWSPETTWYVISLKVISSSDKKSI
jgi:hypothetical protein